MAEMCGVVAKQPIRGKRGSTGGPQTPEFDNQAPSGDDDEFCDYDEGDDVMMEIFIMHMKTHTNTKAFR